MRVPKIVREQPFTGTGDLFSALLLVWTSKGYSVLEATERTVNSLYAVLTRTQQANSNELKLLQSKEDLERPPILFKVEELS